MASFEKGKILKVKKSEGSVEFYDDNWDTGQYFVCFDRYFIFAIDPKAQSPQWELLIPEGDHWDAVHQRVYRNGRADLIKREDLPRNLPPPPATVPSNVVPATKQPQAPETFKVDEYPNLSAFLSNAKDSSITTFLVLFEDTYESLQGDGEFHYPEAIFLDKGKALSYMKVHTGGWKKYHLREIRVRLNGDCINCPDDRRQMFDRFNESNVVRMTEKMLGKDALR